MELGYKYAKAISWKLEMIVMLTFKKRGMNCTMVNIAESWYQKDRQ